MQEENVSVDGVSLNYVHGGEGEPLLMFPGWPGNFSPDDELLNLLGRHFEVYAVNIPGFGKSAPLINADLDTLMKTIEDFVALKKLEKYNLMGFSYGGMVVLNLALREREKVNKIIAVAPIVRFGNFKIKPRLIIKMLLALRKIFPGLVNLISAIIKNEKITEKFYYFITNYHYDGETKDYAKNVMNMQNMDINSCLDMFSLLSKVDFFESLPQIKAKTLVIFGQHDDFLVNYSRELGKVMKTAEIKLVGGEHWNIIVAYGEDQLIDFLKQ